MKDKKDIRTVRRETEISLLGAQNSRTECFFVGNRVIVEGPAANEAFVVATHVQRGGDKRWRDLRTQQGQLGVPVPVAAFVAPPARLYALPRHGLATVRLLTNGGKVEVEVALCRGDTAKVIGENILAALLAKGVIS